MPCGSGGEVPSAEQACLFPVWRRPQSVCHFRFVASFIEVVEDACAYRINLHGKTSPCNFIFPVYRIPILWSWVLVLPLSVCSVQTSMTIGESAFLQVATKHQHAAYATGCSSPRAFSRRAVHSLLLLRSESNMTAAVAPPGFGLWLQVTGGTFSPDPDCVLVTFTHRHPVRLQPPGGLLSPWGCVRQVSSHWAAQGTPPVVAGSCTPVMPGSRGGSSTQAFQV